MPLTIRGIFLGSETETDLEIGRNFDTKSVQLERKRRLCSCIAPRLEPYLNGYTETRAAVNYENAQHFFSARVPLDSNPLNLYDDIQGAFLVRLFKDSDSGAFYILTEFNRTIKANVRRLTIIFSIVVSLVSVANLLFANSIDFYTLLGLAKAGPVSPEFVEPFNRVAFAGASCLGGYLLMFLFYHLEYKIFQCCNGKSLRDFLMTYLGYIQFEFKSIQENAEQTPKEEERELLTFWSTRWNVLLYWTALRALFIEMHVRTIIFQVQRFAAYSVIFVPFASIVALFSVVYSFSVESLYGFNVKTDLYQQGFFYVFFALLLYARFRYLTRALVPIFERLADRGWANFAAMELSSAVHQIMRSYATRLEQLRFNTGPR